MESHVILVSTSMQWEVDKKAYLTELLGGSEVAMLSKTAFKL